VDDQKPLVERIQTSEVPSRDEASSANWVSDEQSATVESSRRTAIHLREITGGRLSAAIRNPNELLGGDW
jgi:hypothetical protein